MATRKRKAKRKAAKRARARAVIVRIPGTTAAKIREAATRTRSTPTKLVIAAVRTHLGLLPPKQPIITHSRAVLTGRMAVTRANVLAVARTRGVAKYHADRAYIASVWDHWPEPRPSFADFKTKLLAMRHAGDIRLVRADLVRAMDPLLLERSETKYQNAEFHFIALD
jgi:hypothetical protein